ncbi:TIR domain-containing protein [Bacillus cereus]|nr:TIR domain-containing protein [Bacillus cereus]
MNYRNKTYVCFDADEDIHYYRLLTALKAKDGKEFNFHNAHDVFQMQKNKIAINNEKYIKEKLQQRLLNTKCFIILVGNKTKNLYKYVRWEIETALLLDLPIIVINLNNTSSIDYKFCPPIVREKLAVHIPYKKEAIKRALNNWPDEYRKLKKENIEGPRHYKDLL